MDRIERSAAIRLAKTAVEDARRPEPTPHLGPSVWTSPDHRIICLCNAVEALIAAIGEVEHG